MTIIEALRSWDKPISDEEVEALKAFIDEINRKDWLLLYEAEQLLKRQGRGSGSIFDKFPILAEFLRGLPGRNDKAFPERYDRFIDEHTEDFLGYMDQNVHGALLTLLQYNEPVDFHRKRIAIRILPLLKDRSVLRVLLHVTSEETDQQLLQEGLLALLQFEPTEEMLDYAARMIIKRNSWDQQYMIRFFSSSSLPDALKMRLYSYLNLYEEGAQGAVIRALGEMHTEEAFERLCDILRENAQGRLVRANTAGLFTCAAQALEKIEDRDSCPILLEGIRTCWGDRFTEAAVILAERDYAPAIEVFESRLIQTDCMLVCAGALCRFGRDYDRNAGIIRRALLKRRTKYGDALFRVAGWLHDKETAESVGSIVASDEEGRVDSRAIEVLGRIGHLAGLPFLRAAVRNIASEHTLLSRLEKIAQAVLEIGRRNDDTEVIREGAELHECARWLYAPSPAQFRHPREPVDVALVADALKRYPELLPVFLTSAQGRITKGLEILNLAWSEAFIPYLEAHLHSLEEKGGPEEEKTAFKEFLLRKQRP